MTTTKADPNGGSLRTFPPTRMRRSRDVNVRTNRHTRSRQAVAWRWVALACVFVGAIHLIFVTMPLGIDAGGVTLVGQQLFASHEQATSLYGNLWLDRSPLLVLIYGIADAVGGAVGVRIASLIAALSIVIVSVIAVRRLGFGQLAPIVAGIAALLVSSPALGSTGASQELFAAAFAAGAVACVLPAIRGVHVNWPVWLAAGVLAMCALLVKQSFIDGFAACIAIATFAPAAPRARARTFCMLGVGVLIPAVATLVWASVDGPGISPLMYAMFGFRLDGVGALANASVGLTHRFVMLAGGMVSAGLPILLPLSVLGLRKLARTTGNRAAGVGAVWLAAGIVGVAGGGYYWTHYMIQLIPSVAVLAAIGLYALATRPTLRRAATISLVTMVVGSSLVGYASGMLNVHQDTTMSAATFLRTNATMEDRLYVLYARANLVYDARMIPAFPYQWSLMYRAMPELEPQLRRLLASPQRPTWIVEYQPATAFGLDKDGTTKQLIAQHYRTVGVVCDIPILLRRDDPRTVTTPPNLACPA